MKKLGGKKGYLARSLFKVSMLIMLLITVIGCSNSEKTNFTKDKSPVVINMDNNQKEFKVLQFADLHLGEGKEDTNLEEEFAFMTKLIKEANPDLIVMTGDNIRYEYGQRILQKFIPFLDTFEIPYATVFGNHDHEAAPKDVLASYYMGGEYSLFQKGPEDIHGVGNYQINVNQNGETKYSFYMIDSNENREYSDLEKENSKWGGKGSYDYIYPNQINWYTESVNKTTKLNNQVVSSLLFFHIPLPEFNAYHNASKEEIVIAQKGEGEPVCSPYVNTGLFDEIKKLESTKGVFVGHDHRNNFVFKYQDVILGYGLKAGNEGYSDPNLQGATLITLKNNFQDVEVEHIYELMNSNKK